MSQALHIILSRPLDVPIGGERWTYMMRRAREDLALELIRTLDDDRSKQFLVGPFATRITRRYVGIEQIEIILPVRAVNVGAEPRMYQSWLPIPTPVAIIQWTFWKRLKFLFTRRLPLD